MSLVAFFRSKNRTIKAQERFKNRKSLKWDCCYFWTRSMPFKNKLCSLPVSNDSKESFVLLGTGKNKDIVVPAEKEVQLCNKQ